MSWHALERRVAALERAVAAMEDARLAAAPDDREGSDNTPEWLRCAAARVGEESLPEARERPLVDAPAPQTHAKGGLFGRRIPGTPW